MNKNILKMIGGTGSITWATILLIAGGVVILFLSIGGSLMPGRRLRGWIEKVLLPRRHRPLGAVVGILLIAAGLGVCILPTIITGCAQRAVRPSPGPPADRVQRMGVVYMGPALKVTLTEERRVVVENIYNDRIAIRISWDRKDPDALGKGEDPFMYPSVYPNVAERAELRNHSTVQIWAWDKNNHIIDQCDISIYL